MNLELTKKLIRFDADFSFEDINGSIVNQPGVYCVYCTKTHFAYIGATQNCKERIAKHFRRLRFGDHPCKEMQSDFVSHSESHFTAFVIEYCEMENAFQIERHWLNCFGESRTYNKVGFINTMDGKMTISLLCQTLGVKPDTMRAAWKRNGLTNFDRRREITEHERTTIFAYYSTSNTPLRETEVPKNTLLHAKNEKRVNTLPPAPAAKVLPVAAPQKQRTFREMLSAFRAFALDAILIGVVLGHAGLIWYDCYVQWETPGILGGGVAWAIVAAALLLAMDETRIRTSAAAMWFIMCVDGAAWWLHYPTFQRPGVPDEITGVFALFLCAASWVALYLYRDKNID